MVVLEDVRVLRDPLAIDRYRLALREQLAAVFRDLRVGVARLVLRVAREGHSADTLYRLSRRGLGSRFLMPCQLRLLLRRFKFPHVANRGAHERRQ